MDNSTKSASSVRDRELGENRSVRNRDPTAFKKSVSGDGCTKAIGEKGSGIKGREKKGP